MNVQAIRYWKQYLEFRKEHNLSPNDLIILSFVYHLNITTIETLGTLMSVKPDTIRRNHIGKFKKSKYIIQIDDRLLLTSTFRKQLKSILENKSCLT